MRKLKSMQFIMFIIVVNAAVSIYFTVLYFVKTNRINERKKMDSALAEAYRIINQTNSKPHETN